MTWFIAAVLFALWRLDCESALTSAQYAVDDAEQWRIR